MYAATSLLPIQNSLSAWMSRMSSAVSLPIAASAAIRSMMRAARQP